MRKQQHTGRSSPKWTRRTIVALGAMVAGLPIVRFALPLDRPNQVEAALLAALRNRGSALEVGHAVLASLPNMRDRAQLVNRTLDDLGMDSDSILDTHAAEIADRLSQRVRTDFARRKTVILDGWLVSATETRLCALAALAWGLGTK
jgi:hypothetical protein